MEFINVKTGRIVSINGVWFDKEKYWTMSNIASPVHPAVGEFEDDIFRFDGNCDFDERNNCFWCEVILKFSWLEYFINQGILTVQLDDKIFSYFISTHKKSILGIIYDITENQLGFERLDKLYYKTHRHIKNYDGEWMEI